MNMYLPFTYLIGWSHLNKWYYGVRYAKTANPTELWTTYFTSSPKVSKFRLEFGEPDVIEVRHTFTDKYVAKLWEDSVLKRIPKNKRTFWLNRRFGDFIGIANSEFSDAHIQKLVLVNTGRKLSDETKVKMRLAKLGKKLGPRTPEVKEKLRVAHLGSKKGPYKTRSDKGKPRKAYKPKNRFANNSK